MKMINKLRYIYYVLFYVILIIVIYVWSLRNVRMRYTYHLNVPHPPTKKQKKQQTNINYLKIFLIFEVSKLGNFFVDF